MSDKIKSHHLGRKAILYVRQSSAHQVMHNQESRLLQYAMRDRLGALGWREIEVIDDDLGRSASGAVTRAGFDRMVAEVCLGKVGAVAAREVSRFARNSRDWQQLIEMCRVVDTLLVDQETVYAPRQGNDRLLLGLKGSLNEYELDLLRQRSLTARHEKARRGELIVAAPIGYVKTADQRLEKDPDRRVQEAIGRVFGKFSELGSVRQTLLWFLEQELQLPTRRANSDLVWRRPSYAMIYRLLTNPVYGGAYAYGRTSRELRYDGPLPRHGSRRKPLGEWLALLPGAHEGYVDWPRWEAIHKVITSNQLRAEQPGAAKRGAALLAGLIRCRRCGRRMFVSYTGRGDVPRYGCWRGALDNGEPRCIAFGGLSADEAIEGELLRVLEPAAVEAALEAHREETRCRDEVLEALKRDLEAARYVADKAFRQYDASDPANRLVAGELELRWNRSLERVCELESRIEQHVGKTPVTAPSSPEQFARLATDLKMIWGDPSTDIRLKKRILRELIREVIADIDAQGGEVILVVHWAGGIHTELRIRRRRRGQTRNSTAQEIVQSVRLLARICSDDVIAGVLNRNDIRTGHGNRWTRERVASLRSHHAIPVYRPEMAEADGWMTLTRAASVLGISPKTLRLAAEQRQIDAEHPLEQGPWVFARLTLQSEAAKCLVDRVRGRRATPAGQRNQQPDLFASMT